MTDLTTHLAHRERLNCPTLKAAQEGTEARRHLGETIPEDFARLRERFNPATDDLYRMAEAFREIYRERKERESKQLECARFRVEGEE